MAMHSLQKAIFEPLNKAARIRVNHLTNPLGEAKDFAEIR
jgi:hypothetical protein